ncbi:MAG: alanine dehydrogenase [Gammaproteobacteria bacterium]|nr:alanine dehydrogenase [Gammaproteobacteria bacterium]MDH5728513.1 alanine dehydrogenase [Gammaproteobacteria bacterium]
MDIGIPKEIKTLEGRVGLVPAACAKLIAAGHKVTIQQGAGELSGYPDEQYTALGVQILPTAEAIYGQAQMIVKVKEPVGPELGLLQSHHLLFSYLHLAAEAELAKKLLAIGLTGVAFETVEDQHGRLPLLAPMSDIAGRLASQIGSNLLHRPNGGKGLLLGGLPAAQRGKVVIIGGGVAGTNAAIVAAGLGAEVTVFDLNRDRLESLRAIGPNVTGLYPYPAEVANAVADADLVVGAVLVIGEKAPHVVSTDMVKSMAPGGVIVDISVDQGGCIETTKPTTYESPTYIEHGVVHFCVTNMPGAVPRSASQALSASLIPYVLTLASGNWRDDEALAKAVNVDGGKLVHPALIKDLPELVN